jgi:hypothetical protein
MKKQLLQSLFIMSMLGLITPMPLYAWRRKQAERLSHIMVGMAGVCGCLTPLPYSYVVRDALRLLSNSTVHIKTNDWRTVDRMVTGIVYAACVSIVTSIFLKVGPTMTSEAWLAKLESSSQRLQLQPLLGRSFIDAKEELVAIANVLEQTTGPLALFKFRALLLAYRSVLQNYLAELTLLSVKEANDEEFQALCKPVVDSFEKMVTNVMCNLTLINQLLRSEQ